jgi:hypothetical protein
LWISKTYFNPSGVGDVIFEKENPMKAIKKAIVLGFRFAAHQEIVTTLEGVVTAQVDDAILTGTKGEVWPIQRSKFESTYDYRLNGTIVDYCYTGTCSKKAIVVEAEEMPEPFEVVVGWSADPIKGKAGDFRLTYGPGDFGAVDRTIFFETYDVVG